MKVRVSSFGADRVAYDLRSMGGTVAVASNVERETARRVVVAAKALAPSRSGKIRAGIKAGKVGRKSAVISEVPGRPYNMFVHFGTWKMSARPYLDWAVGRVEPTVGQVAGSEVDRAIRQAGF